MLTIVLSIILGYYLINLAVVLSRFFFHWFRALWSKSAWFDMQLSGPATEGDPYSSLVVVPWFYDEPKSHFSFSFTPLGFKAFFVPTQTLGAILRDEFGSLFSWQVLRDSARIPIARVEIPGSGKGAFSPGTDLIFFTRDEIRKDDLDRFGTEAGKSIVPGRLVDHVRQIFDPPAFVLKDGNRWTIGYKDSGVRRRIVTRLFEEVGRKVLLKNGLQGAIRIGTSDGADRFVARGQVRWWMKGRMEGDAIVIEGDGLRPGEVTSADWAIVTIPVEREDQRVEDRR